jgi:uncharacterized protein YfaP (DUF2135 family)
MRSWPIHAAEDQRRLAYRALLALSFAALLIALSVAPAWALSFAPARHFAAGLGPAALAVADLNGDDKLDLVVADGKGYGVRVLVGNGRGGFARTGPYATGAGPSSVAVADLDGDGELDVVTGNGADGTVTVLFGTGNGGFDARADFVVGPPPLYVGLHPTGVALADFNQDDFKDVVVCGQPVVGPPHEEAVVLLGDGSGGFAAPYRVPTPDASCDVAIGEFNGDGRVDFVATVVGADQAGAGVLLGDGAGHFSPMTIAGTDLEPCAVTAGLMNGDQMLDLVIAETLEGTGVLEVLLGDGAGGFARAPGGLVKVTDDQGLPRGVAVADLNGDGKLDVASGLGRRALVLRGDGQGGLRRPLAFPVGACPRDIVAADFNRDGLIDLATADYADHSVSLLLQGPAAPPVLRDMTPRRGRLGTVVTLTGAHFGAIRGAGVVRFGTTTASTYVSWSPTKIKVKVPSGTAQGLVKVTVRTVAGRSQAIAFRRL